MPSQTDLDQGGTFRQWTQVYMGPSVGWVRVPQRVPLPTPGGSINNITAAGTYTLNLSTTLVNVSVAGAVTIILPSAKTAGFNAGANPGLFVLASVTIVDVGGNAAAHPITIQALAGQNIMGLASIQITSNYGGFILEPNNMLAGWVNAQ